MKSYIILLYAARIFKNFNFDKFLSEKIIIIPNTVYLDKIDFYIHLTLKCVENKL